MDDQTREKETQEATEGSPEAPRRDFLRKAATVTGAVAAAGLVAGALSPEAEAQPEGKVELLKDTPVRYQRTDQGHSFTMQGPEIAKILAREGLIPKERSDNPQVGIIVQLLQP